MYYLFQNNVEPMVIDMAVEENDNTEEEPVIVESTSLVSDHASLFKHLQSVTTMPAFQPWDWGTSGDLILGNLLYLIVFNYVSVVLTILHMIWNS